MKNTKAQVSERALFQRLSRRLARDGECLRTARLVNDQGSQYENSNTGRYFIVDANKNAIIHTHVDLENCAREIGIMRQWEEVASGE